MDKNAILGLSAVLTKLFFFILLGYLLRWSEQLKTVGAFNTAIAQLFLPATLFVAVGEADLSTLDPLVLGAVVLSKLVVFAAVVGVTVMLDSSKTSVGKATTKSPWITGGIYGIFATGSNDALVGIPIVQAICPQFVSYAVITASVQMAVFNPLGFFLMEKGKHEQQMARIAAMPAAGSSGNELDDSTGLLGDSLAEEARSRAVARVAKQSQINTAKLVWNVVSTPVVFVTLCAAVYTFSLAKVSKKYYGTPLPPLLKAILTTMADPFTCTALLSIGHASYGKIAGLRGRSLQLPLSGPLLHKNSPLSVCVLCSGNGVGGKDGSARLSLHHRLASHRARMLHLLRHVRCNALDNGRCAVPLLCCRSACHVPDNDQHPIC